MWCIIYWITALFWAILVTVWGIKEGVYPSLWQTLLAFIICLALMPILMLIVIFGVACKD